MIPRRLACILKFNFCLLVALGGGDNMIVIVKESLTLLSRLA